MTLTGACPGTVLVQIATGITSGLPVLFGGLLGGIAFVRYGSALKRTSPTPTPPHSPKNHTIQAKYDINPNYVLLGYEMLCAALLGGFSLFGANRAAGTLLHPVLGGALVGAAQATSLLLTGKAVGVSTAYEEVGRWFWRIVSPPPTPVDGASSPRPAPPAKAIPFAAGLFLGSLVLARSIVSAPVEQTEISMARAVVGGFAMVFGSRVAGGCTSGHGISGMAAFSVASFVSVGAMFGGGILTARALVAGGWA